MLKHQTQMKHHEAKLLNEIWNLRQSHMQIKNALDISKVFQLDSIQAESVLN